MQTQCNARQFEFEAVERRAVVAAFDGGTVSSDAGALLLSKLDRGTGLIGRFAGCFEDRRDPDLIEHSVRMLVGQRVLGIALGYEDLIDHDQLRHDPLWAAALGKLEPKRRGERAARASCHGFGLSVPGRVCTRLRRDRASWREPLSQTRIPRSFESWPR